MLIFLCLLFCFCCSLHVILHVSYSTSIYKTATLINFSFMLQFFWFQSVSIYNNVKMFLYYIGFGIIFLPDELLDSIKVDIRNCKQDQALFQLQILIKLLKRMDTLQNYFICPNTEQEPFRHSNITQNTMLTANISCVLRVLHYYFYTSVFLIRFNDILKVLYCVINLLSVFIVLKFKQVNTYFSHHGSNT